MSNENHILAYLQGNLSTAAELKFRDRLASNHTFREEYESVKQMYAYLKEREARSEYSEHLSRLGKKHFRSSQIWHLSSWKKIAAAAALILMTTFANWYLKSPAPDHLYANYADHFALHIVTKSDENTVALLAEKSFNQGNYEQAIAHIEAYLELNEMDTKARLALGISHLEAENNDSALAIFKTIGKGDSTLKYYGIWYEALYYVKIADFAKAKSILQLIPQRERQLYSNAQNLAKKLKRYTEK